MDERRQSIRQSGAIPRVSRLPTLRSSQSVSSLRQAPSQEQLNRANTVGIHNPKLRSVPSIDRGRNLGNTNSITSGQRKPDPSTSRTSRLQTKPLPPPPSRTLVGSRSSSIHRNANTDAAPDNEAQDAVPTVARPMLTRRSSHSSTESPVTPSKGLADSCISPAQPDLPSMLPTVHSDDEETSYTPKGNPPLPRPSLTERTIETLSQLPSSPANRGRPSAFFDQASAARSSSRPASRGSQSSRPSSSYRNDAAFTRPPSRSRSQTRPTSSHRRESAGSMMAYGPLPNMAAAFKTPLAPISGTPPTARTRTSVGGAAKTLRPPSSRIAAPGDIASRTSLRGKLPTPSSTKTLSAPSANLGLSRSKTPNSEERVGPPGHKEDKAHPRTLSARPPRQRASVGGLFKMPPASTTPSNSKPPATRPAPLHVSRNPSLASHKSSNTSGDDTTQSGVSPTSTATTADLNEPGSAGTTNRKSSAALRDQIAKARAAKKAASRLEVDTIKIPVAAGKHAVRSPLIPTDTSFDFGLSDTPFPKTDDPFAQRGMMGSGGGGGGGGNVSNKVLEERLATARTTGRLNIAALNLREIPAEVRRMYDMTSRGVTDGSWAESVDLTRFVAADNELEMLDDSLFPDSDPRDSSGDEDGQCHIFGGLETLDLRSNMLISLPVGLRRLEFLTSLNMSANRITNGSLEVISQITSLRDLKLGGNLFYGPLDGCLCNLVNLETVDLHGNNITSLPPGISALRKLRVLNLAENSFESLPFGVLSELPLVELIARKNRLSGVLMQDAGPNVRLEKLQMLDVSSNQLTHLVSPLTDHPALLMPSLQQLCVSMNRLQELPDLGTCAGLLTLTADENSITAVPQGLTSLRKLRHADFSSNDLRVIPPEISRMDSLSMLRLSGNPLRDKKFCSISTDELKDILAGRLGPDPILNEPEATFTNLLPPALVKRHKDSVASQQQQQRQKQRQQRVSSSFGMVQDPDDDDDNDNVEVDEDEDDFATPPTSAPQSPSTRSRSHTISNEQWVIKAGGLLDRSNTQSSSLHPVVCSRIASNHSVRDVQLHHNLFSVVPESISFFAPTLVCLSLSHNQLMGESYMGDMAINGGGMKLELPALRELSLACNHITSLVPLTTNLISPGLQKLDVSTNRISSLPPGSGLRDAFPELSVLLVPNNHLAELDPEAIRGMRIVDASNNDIAHLNPRIGLLGGIEGGTLEQLNVTGNRFRVPRFNVLDRGTDATLRFLRSRVPVAEMAAWREARGVSVASDEQEMYEDGFNE